MKIRRTANAGVLIELDGLSILLDGVCNKIAPYEETPDTIKKELTENFPDVVLFTHTHDDHYDEEYANAYKEKTLRPVYGSESFLFEQGKVSIRSVPTRHIGRSDVAHASFIIKGSKCIWFMGDASPLEWKKHTNLPTPDVVIAPFAYANTPSAWKNTQALGAKDVIILHLPEKENDPYGLWNAVEENTVNDSSVHIPKMGEVIIY